MTNESTKLWSDLFLPTVRAAYPDAVQFQAMPGDPATPVSEAGEDMRAFLYFVANSVALLSVDSLLVPGRFVSERGVIRYYYTPSQSSIPENQLALRQLIALDAWCGLELKNEKTLHLSEVMTPWVSLASQVPDGTPIHPRQVLPFLATQELSSTLPHVFGEKSKSFSLADAWKHSTPSSSINIRER